LIKRLLVAILSFVKELVKAWDEDKPARLAAGLAYYSLFSLIPLIFIVFTIAGIFVKEVNVAAQLFEKIEKVFGPDLVSLIQGALESLEVSTTSSGVIRSLIGFIALFFAASGLFVNLKYAINTVWQVPPKEYAGLMAFIVNRLLAFVIVIGFGVLLVAVAFVSMIINKLSDWIRIDSTIITIDQIGLVVISIFVFAIFYKILPDAEVKWRDVWGGAIFANILLALGLWIVVTFLGGVNYKSATEAAGALAVMLIAVYYGAQIFLIGAEFTKVYAHRYGSKKEGGTNEIVDESIPE